MNRRHFLQLSVLGVTSVVSRRLMASQGRRNILFIAIDDLQSTAGCLSDKIALTPNMDKLAGGHRFS